MFWSSPQVGDWVRTTRVEHPGVMDVLMGNGVAEGSKGVVVACRGGSVDVDVDDGWGTTRLTIPRHRVKVVRRAGGVERFRSRTGRLAAVRVGVLLAFALPSMWFVVSYWWSNRTFDGIAMAYLMGVLDSAVWIAVRAIHEPIATLVFVVVTSVLWRFAWGR